MKLRLAVFLVSPAALFFVAFLPDAHAASSAVTPTSAKALCWVLDADPTFNGVGTAGQRLLDQGMTLEAAAEALVSAVADNCPNHLGLLERFAHA